MPPMLGSSAELNSFPGSNFAKRWLDRLSSARGPIAFLDESFLSPAQHSDSFYIVAAVIFPRDRVFSLRSQLRALVGSERWHTTESGRTDSGRQKIREFASFLARNSHSVIAVVDELSDHDADAEIGRARAIKALLNELALNHLYLTGTVVIERRMSAGMQQRDNALFRAIRSSSSPGAGLRVIELASKREPLLWAPDLVAWCYRKAYFEKDASFMQDLEKSIQVIRL